MPRVTVSMPKDVHEKLLEYAEKNDESVSSAVTKMTEIGLYVKQHQSENKSPTGMSEVEEHCSTLIIQMNACIKMMIEKQFDYDKDKFKQLNKKAKARLNELAGIKLEDEVI